MLAHLTGCCNLAAFQLCAVWEPWTCAHSVIASIKPYDGRW